jgi:hypothetical protein
MTRTPRFPVEVAADLHRAIGRTSSPRMKALLREAAVLIASPEKDNPIAPGSMERIAQGFGRTLEQSHEDTNLAVAFNRAIHSQYTEGELVNATAIISACGIIAIAYLTSIEDDEGRAAVIRDFCSGIQTMGKDYAP